MQVNELTHSQFLVYMEQIRAGKSHEEAVEYCLNNALNVGDFVSKIVWKRSR